MFLNVLHMISHKVCLSSDIVTVWWSLIKRNNIVIWFFTFILPETIPPVVFRLLIHLCVAVSICFSLRYDPTGKGFLYHSFHGDGSGPPTSPLPHALCKRKGNVPNSADS